MNNGVFKALSHPDRRALLSLLKAGPRTAGELAEHFDVSWPTVSRHLSVLKEAGLVTAERSGTSIIYTLSTSVVEDAASALLALIGTGDET
ncbi:MAG: autorepressor SdpR family transcription factor [Litorimonas sp.]